MLRAIIAAGKGTVQYSAGPATQLDLAVVHLAMHDAIQAYDQRYQPYPAAIAAGEGSATAAAARAAHTVLLTKFPAQVDAIDTCYASSMTGVVLSPADLAASDIVGNMAALNVLSDPRWGRQLSSRSHHALHGWYCQKVTGVQTPARPAWSRRGSATCGRSRSGA